MVWEGEAARLFPIPISGQEDSRRQTYRPTNRQNGRLMTRPPLSSDDAGVVDPDDESIEEEDVDERLRDDREAVDHLFPWAIRGDNLVANTTDEEHVWALLSEARSRDDSNEPSFDSNYEYVLERIDELDEPILDEVCRRSERTQGSELEDKNNATSPYLALIVEDDQFVASAYGLMLSAAGIKVMYAFGVDAALSTINRLGDAFSLVVIDIKMPVGDFLSSYETGGGMKSGIHLAMEVLDVCYGAKVIALSNSTNSL